MHEQKKTIGRPRTTLNDIPENWEEIVIDAAQEGASDVELRCLLGLTQTSWTTLLEDSEEFCITIKRAHDLCQVWWERCGRSMASGQAQGNATTWIFNMKNRFGWNDKAQIDHYSNDGLSTPIFNFTAVQPAPITEIRRTIVGMNQNKVLNIPENATPAQIEAMMRAAFDASKQYDVD